MQMRKPPRLLEGDRVATVSLSWGGAGDEELLWRYYQGKEQIEHTFGIKIVEMPHTLAGSEYAYHHPRERAEDWMQAFCDPSIKGIFSCIGGEDTIRLLPYIDFNIIRNHPKIFMGYSDSTVNHFMCWKAGLSSIYGPALLSDFAENKGIPPYTEKWIRKALFSGETLGPVEPSEQWTSERLEWVLPNKEIRRHFYPNNGCQLLQGKGLASGHLIGGCIEVMDWLRGTSLFPPAEDFNGAVLFIETSEEKPEPHQFRYMLRALGAMGILSVLNGMIFGKPYDEKYKDEYHDQIKKVLTEYGRGDLPVLANLSFGHCEPKCAIPYGAIGQIDCENKNFSILESGTL